MQLEGTDMKVRNCRYSEENLATRKEPRSLIIRLLASLPPAPPRRDIMHDLLKYAHNSCWPER
jgi:hypothetical protein